MFQLEKEYASPYCVIRNYVRGRNFINVCIRKMGGVIVETTHPRLNRRVFDDIDQAIAAVQQLGWQFA
jgi:hypothetical protein